MQPPGLRSVLTPGNAGTFPGALALPPRCSRLLHVRLVQPNPGRRAGVAGGLKAPVALPARGAAALELQSEDWAGPAWLRVSRGPAASGVRGRGATSRRWPPDPNRALALGTVSSLGVQQGVKRAALRSVCFSCSLTCSVLLEADPAMEKPGLVQKHKQASPLKPV